MKPKLCPGCDADLPNEGKRVVMCAKCWASMPQGLRRDFQTADCVENRRAAIGSMLRLLAQRRKKSGGDGQLIFEL